MPTAFAALTKVTLLLRHCLGGKNSHIERATLSIRIRFGLALITHYLDSRINYATAP